MLKGFLISYKNNLSRKDITLINYYLFGRIVKKKSGGKTDLYYYPGLFENTPYIKISNGCYFTEKIIDDFDGKILLILVKNIEFPNEFKFTTAKEYWKNYIKKRNLFVKNF